MNKNTMTLAALALAIPGAFAFGHWSASRSTNPESEAQANSTAKSSTQRSRFASALSGEEASKRGNNRTENSSADDYRMAGGAPFEKLAVEAFDHPSHLKRSLAFAKILESLTPENALATMETMREHGAGGDEWELFRYAWATMDPAAAMEHATSMEGRRQQEAIGDTLTGWASVNPSEATAWLDQLEDGESKSRLRRDLIAGLTDFDIGGATSYVLDLAAQGEEHADRYLERIAQEQLRSGSIQDAVMWSESLPRGELSEEAMERVANRYVNSDPEAAAAWVSKYASEDFGVELIEEVSDEWAERDPQAAVSWLNKLPEGRSREEGIRSALSEWARRDLTAAGEYLQSMPASTTRDAAVSGYARNVVREDPEGAVAWAESIGQDQLRNETMVRTAREWYRRDPEAAAAWLQASGLPEESQTRVTSEQQRRGRRN